MIVDGINKDEIVSYIIDSWDTWKDDRKEKEVLWQDCVSNYLTYIDKSKYDSWPWRSKVCDTASQEIADTIASAIQNALFPNNEDYFKLEGMDETGHKYATQMEKYLYKQITKSNFTEKVRPFIKQISVIGNSAALLPWVNTKKPKKRRVRGDDGIVKVKKVPKLIYDNFSFETLDALDVVFEPYKLYDSGSMCIYRTFKSFDELSRLPDSMIDKDELSFVESEYKSGTNTRADVTDKAERSQIYGINFDPSTDDCEVYIAHGDFECDGEKYEDYVAWVIGSRLVRFEENPYWAGKPIIWGTYDELWFSPYGRGPIEPILGIQELINTFTNQKADILNLIIMGAFAYVNDGIIDPDDLFLRPGGGIEVGDINNIKPLQPNTNVALTYQEIAMLRGRTEGSSAATFLERGVPSGGRKTAMEASILKQGSSSRFNDTIRHIGQGCIEKTLAFYLESLQQFKYGSGDKIDDVDVDEFLPGEYEVNYYGVDTSIIKSQEIQSLMQLLDITSKIPKFSNAMNEGEFLGDLVRLLGLKNSKLIKTADEIKAEQVRQDALAMSQLARPQQGVSPSGETGGEGMPSEMPEGMEGMM